MKYLLLIAFLAAIASLEFVHELSGRDALNMVVCTATHMGPSGVADAYRQHLASHR